MEALEDEDLSADSYYELSKISMIKGDKEKAIQFKAIHLQSKKEAQNAPTPITTYALFLDGNYITNEQMNDKRFLKLLEK